MTRPTPYAPAGVVRSPSWRCSETPRRPSQASQGPARAGQHSPERSQIWATARVEVRSSATTVTSCFAEPVDASWLASVGGQTAPAVRSPAALAAGERDRQARRASAFLIVLCRLVSNGDGISAARTARRPGAAVLAHRLAGDKGPASALVARRLPGWPRAAPAHRA